MQKINKKGFTLIELLVVIAIIGLLSTLAVVSLNNARQKSRDARRVSDVKQVQTALELYYNDAGGYPNSDEADPGDKITYGGTVYMNSVPTAPTPADGSCTSSTNTYNYTALTTSGSNTSYTFEYCLGSATGGIPAGLHTATPGGLY